MEEWAHGLEAMREAVRTKDLKSAGVMPLEGVREAGNYINQAGNDHLNQAAELLLKRTKLQLKLSHGTARKAIIAAFFAHLPKVKKTGVLSEDAIIAGAIKRLQATPRADGTYIFPVVFAPDAKASDFRVGPLRIVAKPKFETEIKDSVERETANAPDEMFGKLLARWTTYLEGYDHLVTVDMAGFEAEMGWLTAREGAEFLLNLIRMLFRFQVTDDIRIGGGFIWEKQRSSLRSATNGELELSASWGPIGTHLDDRWTEYFDRELGGYAKVLASYAYWLVSGNDPGDPILERLRYADHLIAEAYSEPHDHVRLVRTISALETLGLIEGQDKAHNLAVRCACTGGVGDPVRASAVYDVVRGSYALRSAVVHGDAPAQRDVRLAFLKVEEHLLEIYLRFLTLFAAISHRVKPQSVRPLRRALKERIDLFFWAPDLATW